MSRKVQLRSALALALVSLLTRFLRAVDARVIYFSSAAFRRPHGTGAIHEALEGPLRSFPAPLELIERLWIIAPSRKVQLHVPRAVSCDHAKPWTYREMISGRWGTFLDSSSRAGVGGCDAVREMQKVEGSSESSPSWLWEVTRSLSSSRLRWRRSQV